MFKQPMWLKSSLIQHLSNILAQHAKLLLEFLLGIKAVPLNNQSEDSSEILPQGIRRCN